MPDLDDLSVHITTAAQRVDHHSLLKDLSDNDYTDNDYYSVPAKSLSSSVITKCGAKKTQTGSAVKKKASKKTMNAKGKPPIPPCEKCLVPQAASRTLPGQKPAATCGAASQSQSTSLCIGRM